MPVFRFVLVHANRQFPLQQVVELPDGHAACAHAEAAIKQVFEDAKNAYEWSDWHLSVRNQDDEEFALLSIAIETLGQSAATDQECMGGGALKGTAINPMHWRLRALFSGGHELPRLGLLGNIPHGVRAPSALRDRAKCLKIRGWR
jgi:hypothetical protein